MKWTVRDDNDDQMVYSVYYRGDGEARWLLLKDNLTDKFYSFDASLLPDGGYTIEVVASDAPSHSPGQALTSVRDSARFEVDTTPPRIDDLKASAGRRADSRDLPRRRWIFQHQARRIFGRRRRLAIRGAGRPACRFKDREL